MPLDCFTLAGMIVSILQGAVWLLVWAAALHLGRLGLAGWGRPLPPLPEVTLAGSPGDLPKITVQLPMRNEQAVAERVLRAACALDWPADRLEVQALDDSDDETSAIIDQTAVALRAEGHDVPVLRRPDRAHFKAGNLQHGLAHAMGEFVAVLDADSVPPADLLRRLVPPLLADPGLAFVQARWSFDNEDDSLLTRVQALILHGLMLVEQVALSDAGLPLQFNGSGGIWRRTALDAAGGWVPGATSSLTEDLDLSYRARLRGLRGRHLPQVAVPTELPATMASFRAQQQRWVRGGAQALRGLFSRLLAGDLSRAERLAMIGHLARHVRQPLLMLVPLWLPLATLHLVPVLHIPGLWAASLLALHAALGLYYGAALRRLGRSPVAAVLLGPALVALSMGLSLALSAALLGGLLGGPAEFVRTPKTGRGTLHPAAQGGGGPARRPRVPPAELLIGLGQVGLAVVLAWRGEWDSALACLVFVAAGFLWVGAGGLDLGRSRRPQAPVPP